MREALAYYLATTGEEQVSAAVLRDVRAVQIDPTVIANPDNRGFAAGSNQGMRAADAVGGA